MPDPLAITIDKLIVHKIDHLRDTQARLSDEETPLTPQVRSFFESLTVDKLKHAHARRGRFQVDDNGVQALCADIGSGTCSFVDGSKALARVLFEAIDMRKSISPGDLVVYTYGDPENRTNSRWVAALKMDPGDAVVTSRVQVGSGWRVDVEVTSGASSASDLQKCVFVAPLDLREMQGYDLIVLDLQRGQRGVGRPVATFFRKRFLACAVDLNPQENTRCFLEASYSWGRARGWCDAQFGRFWQCVRQAAEGELVDVAAVAQLAIADPSQRDAYCDYMLDRGVTELTFAPDPAEARKRFEIKHFRGDYDLTISVRASEVGEGRTLSYTRDGQTNETIVTIRTITWEERTRLAR